MDSELSRDVAAIVAAVFGTLAAISGQLAYWESRKAELPKYFGGQPIEPDTSEESLREEGRRERADLKAKIFQSSTTALVVATALVGLYAGFARNVTLGVAILGVIIGVGQPIAALRRWWPQARTIAAQTEYYVEMHQGLKGLSVDEQRREFTKRHPKLARLLW